MEFRRGNIEYRPDRPVCPGCGWKGAADRCPHCGKATQPRIRIVWYINGERMRELTDTWRERDAGEILRRKEEEYWRQQELGVTRDVGGTLERAAEEFTADIIASKSENYRKQVKTAINALARGVGWNQQVHLITLDALVAFKKEGLDFCSGATVRSYLLVLRRFFAWLLRRGWIRHNPAADVDLPGAKARKGCLRPEEVGPFLAACSSVLGPSEAALFTIYTLGGLRKGEAVNLRHRDVDLDERWANVLDFEGDELTPAWSPKTEASVRAAALHPLVVAALRRVEAVQRADGSVSPWVFPVLDERRKQRICDSRGRVQPVRGDRRSPSTTFLGDKLKVALEAAGINRHLTVHDLRRSFAVLLQEAGAPDSIIRQALGHGGKGVTEVNYLPRRDPAIQRWVDQIKVEVPTGEAAAKTTIKIEVIEPEDSWVGEVTAPRLPPRGGFLGAN